MSLNRKQKKEKKCFIASWAWTEAKKYIYKKKIHNAPLLQEPKLLAQKNAPSWAKTVKKTNAPSFHEFKL